MELLKKAAELLGTEGAIVKAPGFSNEAKMVVSHSGKCPHLVRPKRKSGGYMCDEDCPQYKSAKICSHIVATAEYNKELDQFVASYSSVKIKPNITKLATTARMRSEGYGSRLCVCLSPLILALQAPNRLMSNNNGSSTTSTRKIMWQFR